MIIGTGGTIAGESQEEIATEYKAGQLKIEKLIEKIPYVKSIANVTATDMFEIDSCDITFKDLKKLAEYINGESLKNDIDGFVITHGTDTLEETAYFLNLTLKTDKPVVLTGSIRPGTAISPDGPINLYQSIALASNDESKGKGVLVVFCDGIYGARDVSKINTFIAQAFNQKDLGCLGYMQYQKPFFYNYTAKKHTVNTIFDISSIAEFPKIEIFYFYVGADEKILENMAKTSDGIVIAGAGCGGVSTALDEKVEALVKSGFPVVRSSRIGNGLVTFSKDKINKKGICANNLNPQKARILLSLALSTTKELNEIQDLFNTY